MRLDRRRRSELAEIIAHYPGTPGDRLRAYFHSRGYHGTLTDQEAQWLAELGIPPSVGTLTDRKQRLLASPGETIGEKVERRHRPRVRIERVGQLAYPAPVAQPLRWWEYHVLLWAA